MLTEDGLVFDDPNFSGRATLVNERVLVFPYRWRDRPGTEVVETIVFPTTESRCRLWQCFEGGELARLTIIRERRVDEIPEEWE